MNTKNLFQKSVLLALVATLVLAAFPMTSALAAPSSGPTPPAGGQTGISNDRLETIWNKMLNRYERVGQMFDGDSKLVDHAQKMIARLKENGKPTADLEAALAAYQDALKKGRPIFESCKGIVNSHKGFDANGKVTDSALAKDTLKDFAAKLGDLREAMDGTGKALGKLMKSIREQYAPTPTPVPSSGS
jgi:hypothetical protein